MEKVLSRYSFFPSGQAPALWLAPGYQLEWLEWGEVLSRYPFFPLGVWPEVSHQHLRLMSAPGKSAESDHPLVTTNSLSGSGAEMRKTPRKYSFKSHLPNVCFAHSALPQPLVHIKMLEPEAAIS